MPHPDEGLIHAWLDGELDAAEAARVEALVASDPEWTAVAAEARGLIAASARIVGSLDRVPANVIPVAASAPQGTTSRWILRAAAVLLLIGGSAVVLNRSSVDTVDITVPVQQLAKVPVVVPPVANTPVPAAASQQAQKKKLADSKNIIPKQELDLAKQREATRDKDAGAVVGELRSSAVAAGSAGAASNLASPARRADAAPAAAPAPSQAARAAKAQSFVALDQVIISSVRCYSQRAPADSASRIIRLDSAALADSIRLEKLTLHGDTLAAVNGKLIAVLVRCPAP